MAVDALARALAAGKVPVDAYQMAVAGGYTGTKEQFEEDMGNSGANATNAADSADAAAASATTASNAAANFAPAYSSSATYAVGDHVLYDGGYYVCNTAITTAEEWTAAHWTATKVGPEITDLKNAVSMIEDEGIANEAIDFDTATSKSGSINSSGKWSNAYDTNETFFVPVDANSLQIVITAKSSNEAYIAFLRNDTITFGETADFAGGYTNRIKINAGETKTYQIPNDCTYVGIIKRASSSNYTPESASIKLFVIPKIDSTLSIPNAAADAEVVGQLRDFVDKVVNVGITTGNVNFGTVENKQGIIDSSGEWAHVESNYYTYFIPVDASKQIETTVTSQATRGSYISFLKDDTVSEGQSANFATGYTGYIEMAADITVTLDIPIDCAYIGVTQYKNALSYKPQSMSIKTYSIPKVDKTLTISGDAADAEITGDKINFIIDKITTDSPIIFEDENEYKYIINTSTFKWQGDPTHSSRSYSVAVPDNCIKITITANDDNYTEYAFLTSNTHLHNTAVDLCPDTSVMTIDAGTSETVLIPQTCKYIYFYKTNSDASINRTPAFASFDVVIDFYDLEPNVSNSPSQIFNIDLSDEGSYDGIITNFTLENISDDGYTPDTGWENRLKINKYVVCDTVAYRANISLETAGTGVCVLGTETAYGSDHATLVKFDFGNALVSFLTGSDDEAGANINGKSIPEYTYDSFALENLSGTEYRIEIGRVNRCVYAKVYNLKTSQLCGEKTLTIYETDSGYGGKAGAMYDFPNLGVISGTITFKRVSASVPTSVFAVFIGDSITEGSKLALDDVWANKCIEYLGSGLNCGRGGGYITSALACVQDVIPVILPKYVIVTIGTNGTPTLAQYNLLIKKIRNLGAIPIINAIPMNTRDTSEELASKIATILSLNTDHCRFDVATAINNDPSQGKNASLYNSDGLHPNAAGGVAMYNQFVADVGWIKI